MEARERLSSLATYWWIKKGAETFFYALGNPNDQGLDTQVVFWIPAIGIWVRMRIRERVPFLTTQIHLAAWIHGFMFRCLPGSPFRALNNGIRRGMNEALERKTRMWNEVHRSCEWASTPPGQWELYGKEGLDWDRWFDGSSSLLSPFTSDIRYKIRGT